MPEPKPAPRCPRCFSARCELHEQKPPLRTYGCCLDCGRVGDVTAFVPPLPTLRRRKGLGVLPALVLAAEALDGFGRGRRRR